MFVNIIYFDNNEDVDIIYVPDFIYDKIELYGQQFCNWLDLGNIDEEYYIIINGKKCVSLETTGFVNWLNKFFCLDNDKAHIVEQHTTLNPLYKTVDF